MSARVGFVVLALALGAGGARANETDPWYAWLHPPREGTVALNRAINERFERGLSFAKPEHTCREAAERMTNGMRTAAFFFFLGDLSSWGVDYAPRTASEYFERATRDGSYRHVYGLMPLDPAMRVGEVLFGTDKLGHFFTNGLRQYDRYQEERAAGRSDEAALQAAVQEGIDEERTWLGLYPSGILSYADLEANYRGLTFYRALCEEGGLVRTDDGWRLAQRFDIARWVNPCWDEAYRTSYFGRAGDAVQRGLAEMCTDLDASARLRAYRAQGCGSPSVDLIDDLVKAGTLPDPAPWSFERVCGGQRTAGR